MEIIKIWNDKIAPNQLDRVEQSLKDGELIIYPTDTLYAIGCDALNSKAIEQICRLKRINPVKQHLSVICSDISMAAKYAKIDNAAFNLLKEYTPGPYTFILPTSSALPKQFKGRKTVGIRIPDSDVCRDIAERLGNPIITTSVAYDSDEYDEDFLREPDLIANSLDGDVALMIDGGEGGIEGSTIIDLTTSEPEVIRQGKGEFEV